MAWPNVGRPVGPDNHDRPQLGDGAQVTQELRGGPVSPVQVLEHEEHRVLPSGERQQADHSAEGQILFRIGVGGGGGRAPRDLADEGRDQAGQLAAMLLDMHFEHLGRRMGHEVVQGLDEGLVGQAEILLGAAVANDGTVLVCRSGQD